MKINIDTNKLVNYLAGIMVIGAFSVSVGAIVDFQNIKREVVSLKNSDLKQNSHLTIMSQVVCEMAVKQELSKDTLEKCLKLKISN